MTRGAGAGRGIGPGPRTMEGGIVTGLSDDEVTRIRTAEPAGSGTVPLFLSLFLLVLAFFIILVSISTIEDVRSKAVMKSLTSTFADILPPSTDLTKLMSKTGEVIGAEEFQGEIAGLFTTHVRAVKVEVVQPGRAMRLTIPADALFFPDGEQIRPGRRDLLDRLVSSLSGRPEALRFDMQALFGDRYVDGTAMPIGETLPMRRAGALARALLGRGVPSDGLSVGLQPGDPDELVMWFHVRARGEAQVRFDAGQVVRGAADAPSDPPEARP